MSNCDNSRTHFKGQNSTFFFTSKYKNKQQNRQGFQNRLTSDTFSMDCGPNPWQSDCRHLNDPNCSGPLREY